MSDEKFNLDDYTDPGLADYGPDGGIADSIGPIVLCLIFLVLIAWDIYQS